MEIKNGSKSINWLDKSFGPVGTNAGYFILVVGIVMTFSSPLALILVLFGAFFAFSGTCVVIDYIKKRIRFLTNYFGFLPFGHWIELENDMKLGIKKSNEVWRSYSMGNQVLDIEDMEYRIWLLDTEGEKIIPLKKAKNLDLAKTELEKMSVKLGLNQC